MRFILPRIIFFSACLTTACHAAPIEVGDLVSPAQAIYSAAKVAPGGIRGRFAFLVQAGGHQDGNVYLNSELDYRDQRNLTVAISPRGTRELIAKHTLDPVTFFRGKRIVVDGVARRVTIAFVLKGKKTDKYYYQTHVVVNSAQQIHLLSP